MSCTKTNKLLLFLSSFPLLYEMTVKCVENDNHSPNYDLELTSRQKMPQKEYDRNRPVFMRKAVSQMMEKQTKMEVTYALGHNIQKYSNRENNKHNFPMIETHPQTYKKYEQTGAIEDSGSLETYFPAKQIDEIRNTGEDSIEVFLPAKSKENKVKHTLTPIKSQINRYLKKSMKFKEVTKHIVHAKEIYMQPHMVKEDKQIAQFTIHLYRQALMVFESLKEKTEDDKIKQQINFLMQDYEDKFGDFITRTQNQRIKTKLGKQKVILNTLETSNRILSRLINYLIGKMGNSALRMGGTQALTNEANKTMIIENNHICKKFDICKNQNGLSNYVVDVFNIALAASDEQLKELFNAWTEVLKYKDYNQIFFKSTENNYQQAIKDLEKYPPTLLRPILLIIKNLIMNRNKPIEVVGATDVRVNKTIAFLEMLDVWDTAIPPNEQNRLEWNDIKTSLNDWKHGNRRDILEIMELFVNNLYKGVHQFDAPTRENYDRNLNILMGSL